MSNPKNILDNYRSYSYYHVMIACDSTETGDLLASETDLDLFSSSRTETRTRDVQRIGVNNNFYVILTNSAADADFYISDISWNTVMTPQANGSSSDGINYHTSAITGEMTMREPKGVKFMNVLRQAGLDMNVDPKSMFMLLKTIFIGETDRGTTDYISSIEPLMFQIYDISAQFSFVGATYAISFASVTDGVGSTQSMSYIGDGISLELDVGGDTVERAMEKLQNKINNKYQDFKKRLKAASICADVDVDWDGEYVDVEYRIHVDNEFYREALIGHPDEEIRNLQQNSTNSSTVEVSKDGKASIMSLIENIMKSSGEIVIADNPSKKADYLVRIDPRPLQAVSSVTLADGTTLNSRNDDVAAESEFRVRHQADIERIEEEIDESEKENSQKFMFKIHTTLETADDRYIIHYNIKRHQIPMNLVQDDSAVQYTWPPNGQGIEFDYIYTGKNVDIEEFDMNMKMGMAFYQTLASSDNVPSARDTVSSSIPQNVSNGTGVQNVFTVGGDTGEPSDAKSKKPLLLGMTVKDVDKRNKQIPGANLSYDALIAKFAGLESVSATLTIRGNPQLLAESSPLPTRLREGNSFQVVTSDFTQNDEQPPRTIMPRMWEQPGWVRINVHMPTDDRDNPDFSERFWYEGWYYLREIENSFENGNFKQTLHIHAFPTDFDNDTHLGNSDEECTEEEVRALLDNEEGAPNTAFEFLTATETRRQTENAEDSNAEEESVGFWQRVRGRTRELLGTDDN